MKKSDLEQYRIHLTNQLGRPNDVLGMQILDSLEKVINYYRPKSPAFFTDIKDWETHVKASKKVAALTQFDYE